MKIEKQQVKESLIKYLKTIGKGPIPFSAIIFGVYYNLTRDSIEFFNTYQYQIDLSNQRINNKTAIELLEKGPIETVLMEELIWSFINNGILIKKLNPFDPPKEDTFQLTDWGIKVLSDVKPSPYDYEGFLKDISDLIDSITSFYLVQSLECFYRNLYTPSAIMLGVASENIIIEISKLVETKLGRKEKYQKTLKENRYSISGHILALGDFIKNKKSDLPEEVKVNIEKEFECFFEILRRARNDAGHPSEIRIDKDEAYTNYIIFRSFCKKAFKLKKWVEEQVVI
jgi:hypothetical protein